MSGSSLKGEGWQGENLGWRLEEEGGQEQKSNKDVLSPNTRKMTDQRRVMGHVYECEPSAKVDTLGPPS